MSKTEGEKLGRKTRTRANGEGTIFKRVRNGKTRWYAELVVGYDTEGKKKVLRASGDTRKEVADQLAKWLSDRNAGKPLPVTKLTLGEYLDRWMETVVKHDCRPTTMNTYRWAVDTHLKPELGDRKLTALTPTEIQEMYHRKREQGLSAFTVRNIHAVLHRALEHAKRQGLVNTNVADLVQVPRTGPQQPTVFTPDEARRILEAAKEERLHAAFVIAIYLGLRIGELLALQWDDINWEEKTITIRRQFNDANGKLIRQEFPKTKSSYRTLDMPEAVVAALRKWRVEQAKERLLVGEAWAEPNLIFTTQIGTPYLPNNWRKRDYRRVLERAGVPYRKPHALRHTAITAMGAAGLPARTAQELAGHSNVGVTLEIYTHVFREDKRAAAKALDAFWAEKKEGQGS